MKPLSFFSRRLYQHSGLIPFVMVVVVYTAFLSLTLFYSAAEMNRLAGAPVKFLDLMFFRTPAETYAMLDHYGKALAFYAEFERTTDLFYPILYTLMLLVGLSWGWKSKWENSPRAMFNLLPLIPLLLDFAENFTILRMIRFLPTRYDHLAAATAFFTNVKMAAFGICVFLMMTGLFQKMLERKKA